MKVGLGFDVHRLVKDRKLILGGVEIPFDKGLLGHSDADVLCHAIGDALLGAASLGDLGTHFPDTDARFAGISSLKLLKDILKLIRKKGFRIINVDSILVMEQPKVAPYISRMKECISTCLDIEVEQISIKATTTEGLGFTGRGEGIAAFSVALVDCDK